MSEEKEIRAFNLKIIKTTIKDKEGKESHNFQIQAENTGISDMEIVFLLEGWIEKIKSKIKSNMF